jgi:WD40-like Beta Propeller Repeat
MLQQPTWMRRGIQLAASLTGLVALAFATLPAQAAPFDGRRSQFADQGFNIVWQRTDSLNVRGGRTWYWGPQPWFDYAEFYRQGIGGLRSVQYFDKARMEINNPTDRSVQNGVTNGLLVVELVAGHLKKGNDPYDFDYRQPADVPVAGNPKADNPNSPTYAAFVNLATFDNNGYKDPNRLDQRIGTTLDAGGNLAFRQDLADAHPETAIVQYNSLTGHNIPQVFWDFMNMQGPVVEGGAIGNRPVVDWLFAMGLPITDAYWARAKIGATEKDVLVQLFERRVLTYVPDNPAGYKVEMGNVGQHYFQWRYPHLGQPWAAPDPDPVPLYVSNGNNIGENHDPHWEIYFWKLVGGVVRLTDAPAESLAFSYRRSWDPAQTRVIGDSRRGDGKHRQIYEFNFPYLYQFQPPFSEPSVRRLTYSDGTLPPTSMPYAPNVANDYNPSISPDGTKIVFVSDRDGTPQLYITTANGMSYPQRLNSDGCLTQVPTWRPDGRGLYWEQRCGGGKFAIMTGDLQYNDESQTWVDARLTNIHALTDQGSDNRYPRVSPDGKTIAFTSYRDGNGEIYSIDTSGGSLKRLTSSPAEDEAASWNGNGSQLVFASNRDGDYEIYVMNADGSGQAALTDNAVEDRWPAWAQ